MKRTSIKKIMVYYAYWSEKKLFGVHAADEDCIDIIVQYDSGYERKFFFGGYKGVHLPLSAIESTVPKSVQEFIRTAETKEVYEFRRENSTPFDEFVFE